MGTREMIRAFITTNFYAPDHAALLDDASLLDQGLIDSTGVLEIVSYLESTFHITVEDDDMTSENLDSIEGISNFVAAKLSPA
jgi:acyl carrier protein